MSGEEEHSKVSRINLIDLAGSERSTVAQTCGDRLKVSHLPPLAKAHTPVSSHCCIILIVATPILMVAHPILVMATLYSNGGPPYSNGGPPYYNGGHTSF